MRKFILSIALASATAWAWALPSLSDVETQVQQGHYAQAESMMREVVAAKPNSARAHYIYAEILAHDGKFDAAAGEARLARQLDPDIKFTNADKFAAFEAMLQRQQAQATRARVAPSATESFARNAPRGDGAGSGTSFGRDPELGLDRWLGADRVSALARFVAQPRRGGGRGIGRRRDGAGRVWRDADESERRPTRHAVRPRLSRRAAGCRHARPRGGRRRRRRRGHACRSAAAPALRAERRRSRQRRPGWLFRFAPGRRRAREPADRLRHRRLGLGLGIESTSAVAVAAAATAAAGTDPSRGVLRPAPARLDSRACRRDLGAER